MDINLTGQIAASLTQSWWISIGSGIIGGFVTGGIALIGIKMTQNHDERKEEKIRKSTMLQKKKQVYSELMGLKKLLVTIKQSFYISNIQASYLNYGYICKLICKEDDSTPFQMYQEEVRLRNELELNSAESEKDLWTTIGLVQVTFSNSSILKDSIANIARIEKELDKFEKKIYDEDHNNSNDINEEDDSLISENPDLWIQKKGEFITSWRNDRSNDAEEQTNALDSGIDDLLKCLKDQIEAEEESAIT